MFEGDWLPVDGDAARAREHADAALVAAQRLGLASMRTRAERLLAS